jgi:hypothetical protein
MCDEETTRQSKNKMVKYNKPLSMVDFAEPKSAHFEFSSSNFYSAGSHTEHHWRCF